MITHAWDVIVMTEHEAKPRSPPDLAPLPVQPDGDLGRRPDARRSGLIDVLLGQLRPEPRQSQDQQPKRSSLREALGVSSVRLMTGCQLGSPAMLPGRRNLRACSTQCGFMAQRQRPTG